MPVTKKRSRRYYSFQCTLNHAGKRVKGGLKTLYITNEGGQIVKTCMRKETIKCSIKTQSAALRAACSSKAHNDETHVDLVNPRIRNKILHNRPGGMGWTTGTSPGDF